MTDHQLFILVTVCLQAFVLIMYLVEMASDKYPYTSKKTLGDAASAALFTFFFIVWGVIIY